MKSKNISYIGLLLLLLWASYVYFSLQAPQYSNPYNLTDFSRYLVGISVYIPVLVIWLAAVYGATHLFAYVKIVKNTLDGGGLYPISIGINLMVIHFISSSFLNLIKTYNKNDPAFFAQLTIASNLLYVAVYLVAFYYIWKGSQKLITTLKYDTTSKIHLVAGGLVMLGLMGLYLLALFTNPNRELSQSIDIQATYFLPDNLIILFIVIPSFITWIFSLFAFHNLSVLRKNTKGILYKKALSNLVYGLLAIISGSILTQGLSSIGSSRLLAFGLGGVLVIVYILLLIIIVGYVLVALGSKKLSKIEQV